MRHVFATTQVLYQEVFVAIFILRALNCDDALERNRLQNECIVTWNNVLLDLREYILFYVFGLGTWVLKVILCSGRIKRMTRLTWLPTRWVKVMAMDMDICRSNTIDSQRFRLKRRMALPTEVDPATIICQEPALLTTVPIHQLRFPHLDHIHDIHCAVLLLVPPRTNIVSVAKRPFCWNVWLLSGILNCVNSSDIPRRHHDESLFDSVALGHWPFRRN